MIEYTDTKNMRRALLISYFTKTSSIEKPSYFHAEQLYMLYIVPFDFVPPN